MYERATTHKSQRIILATDYTCPILQYLDTFSLGLQSPSRLVIPEDSDSRRIHQLYSRSVDYRISEFLLQPHSDMGDSMCLDFLLLKAGWTGTLTRYTSMIER